MVSAGSVGGRPRAALTEQRTMTRTTFWPPSRRITGTFDRGQMLCLSVAEPDQHRQRHQKHHFPAAPAASRDGRRRSNLLTSWARAASLIEHAPRTPLILLGLIGPALDIEPWVVPLDVGHVLTRLER